MNYTVNMEKITSVSLNTIMFTNLDYWDVKRYTGSPIQSKYSVKPLGLYIIERNEKVKPFLEPDAEFSILGVNNKIGLFDAYVERGCNINQPYKAVHVNDLAYNPYRVNVGSIGIKTTSHKHKYISPAYVVFYCKNELFADFLFILFKSNTFNKIINENTTGAVRQNLKFDILYRLHIPVPPIQIQEKLIIEYDDKLGICSQLEAKSWQLEQEIEEYLFNILGIDKNVERTKKRGLNFVRFNFTDRWAVEFLFNLHSLNHIRSGKYPVQSISDFLISYRYGLSIKSSKKTIGIPMLRMNNINNSELIINDLKYIKLNENDKNKFLLDKGDLLFNRTNSKELVGKTAVFNIDGEYTFASYIIRLKLNEMKVNVNYINYLFNSKIGRTQIDLISRQILGQANVNSKELRAFIFPIPPINIQNQIEHRISGMKEEIKQLRNEAEKKRKQAIIDFEREIFEI